MATVEREAFNAGVGVAGRFERKREIFRVSCGDWDGALFGLAIRVIHNPFFFFFSRLVYAVGRLVLNDIC